MKKLVLPLILSTALASCAPTSSSGGPSSAGTASPQQPAASTAVATATAAASSAIPKIPDPVAVEVSVAGSALLVLDITNTICDVRPSCVTSVPKIANLVKKARDAKVPVIYSTTTTAGTQVRSEIAPQTGDPVVQGRADKFYQTNLEQVLKDKNVQTAVVVGSASNGAVLYTVFGLNLRAITVVVAQDGISAEPEFPTTVTRWQLLNEPGFANADNKPLAKGQVTLSTTDLITFK